MLFDLFICHASEDKEELVRPLAELLQKENIEVWYDEFSLKLGDSIRRSIDKSLSQSRFGIVVISPAFLKKQWTQYELDGLTEKEISGRDKVILPIWHNIDYKEVLSYSPSLANKKAAISENGLQKIVKEIIEVIHPQGSPLISARDTLLNWGVTPPVITDAYWLDVVEASNRAYSFGATIPPEAIWGRWSFPLPSNNRNAKDWGERLAWTAMQLSWTAKADSIPISPLTHPMEVLEFVYGEPGLYETCLEFPKLTDEYAPQLTIAGFGGELEEEFENHFSKSKKEGVRNRKEKSTVGSALTVDGKAPECDEIWALRHQHFGYYKPSIISYEYFHGGMFGPQVSPFYDAEHLCWLISKQSEWLPLKIREYLLDGALKSTHWTWGFISTDKGGNWKNNGMFERTLLKSIDNKKVFEWTKASKEDVMNRISSAINELSLPEKADELFDKLNNLNAPQKWIDAREGREDKRRKKR